MTNPPHLVNRSEAARILHCANATVDAYVRRGLLTRYRVKATGRIVYKRSEVEAFAQAQNELIEEAN